MKRYTVWSVSYALMLCLLVVGIGIEVVGNALGQEGELRPGIDYVPGQVVVRFSEAHMPSETRFTAFPPRFALPELDSLMQSYGGVRIKKFLPSWNGATSNAARKLERTFVVNFDGRYDSQDIVDVWAQLPYFERVELNRIYQIEYHGVVRVVPDTTETEFELQWHMDGDLYHPTQSDSADIDMPEAWAIEMGDPNVVIGIIDEGAMLDTTTTDAEGWKLHSDFNYLWLSEEDHQSPGKLNQLDIDCTVNFTDDNEDGVRDNIIGHNYFFGFECSSDATSTCPECQTPGDELKEAFYEGMPVNWQLEICGQTCSIDSFWTPISWNIQKYNTHGVRVASFAAGRLEGDNMVGVAPSSKVYFVRNIGGDIVHTASMLYETAAHTDVINMSWGIVAGLPPGDLFVLALEAIGQSDVVLVASTGNGGGNATNVPYPARSPHVLAVGATTNEAILWIDSSWNTNQPLVDVVAPGYVVWSDSHSACNGPLPCPITETIQAGNGTSYAAPLAAGLAALIRSRFPGLNAEQVRQRIKASAQFRSAWADGNVQDPTGVKRYGSGKINAYHALTEWGTVTANTTWGAVSGMPDTLYVSGDLIIDTGKILTLNKGTVVRVAPKDILNSGDDTTKIEIVVKGEIKLGTAGTGPIVFESFVDGTPTDSDWVGIRVDSPSAGDALEGITVRNAKVGIEVVSGKLLLKDNVVEDCETGIKISSANVTIDTCTVQDNTAFGIYAVANDSTLTIKRSIVKLNDVGIYLADLADALPTTVTKCNITDNGIGIRIFADGAAPASMQITFCDIKDNDTGIEVEGVSAVTIKSCLISGNNVNGISCLADANIQLRTNNIKNSLVGIFCDNSDPKIRRGNIIKLNSTGIKCDNFSNAVVESTTIDSNGKGVTVLNGSYPELGRTTVSPPPPSKGYNAIENDTTYSVANYTSNYIKAEQNYWGPTGPNPPSRFVGSVDRFPFLTRKPENGPQPYEDPGEAPVFQPSDEVPVAFGISNGYPNPFNPATRLDYQVPRPGGHVLITVFSVKGQRVATLADKYQAPGFYTATWDGKSDRGAGVATGVYFVQMQAANFTKTRKLVFLK